jgi:hypothetical protein
MFVCYTLTFIILTIHANVDTRYIKRASWYMSYKKDLTMA